MRAPPRGGLCDTVEKTQPLTQTITTKGFVPLAFGSGLVQVPRSTELQQQSEGDLENLV